MDVTDALLSAVVTATPEIAAFLDADGVVGWVNPAFVTHWPCAQTPTGRGLLDVVHPDDRATVQNAWELVRSGSTRSIHCRVRLGCDHTHRLGGVRLTRVAAGGAGSVVVHVRAAEAGAVDRHGVDALTGLCDRAGLLAEVDSALAGGAVAHLLLVDLDHFRLVNESLGHAAGDDVLVTVGRRLRRGAHDGDVVARLSGDEFAVLCAHSDESTAGLAERLREQVALPVPLGGSEHILDSSVGVVPLEPMTGTVEALAAADSAVFLAKSRGRGRVETFDPALRDTAVRTLRRVSELRHAASTDQLLLHYQPIVELSTGTTIGCEALLRWHHPDDGLLSAGEFIELAEVSGLVNDLTETLLGDACRAARQLGDLADTRPAAYVSVNLSPRQLADLRLVHRVDTALHRSGATPGQLMVEITETAMMDDVAGAIETLTQLRDRGVRVALDDFGTGFSSLRHLQHFPIDLLKIPKPFVDSLGTPGDDAALALAILEIARSLGLRVIAEGIERPEQATRLRELGCRFGQGFLMARPMSEPMMREALERDLAAHGTG
jgi:diguanylate cyclase (GGDEF)-like protein